MVWSPKDVYDLTLPILPAWKYFGLPAYKIIKTPNFKSLTHNNSKLNYIMVIISTTAYLYYFKVGDKNTNSFEKHMTMYRLVASFVNYMGAVIFCHKHKNKFLSNIEKCALLQQRLNKLGKKEHSFNKMAKILLTIYTTKLSSMIVVTVNDIVKISTSESHSTVKLGWYCNFITEMFLFYFLIVLRSLYSQLLNCTKFKESAQQVKELGKIHKDLNKLAMEVNETFGELMLLRFSGDFIYLIVGLSSNAVLNAEYETVLDFVWTFTVYVLWIPMALGFIALTVWYFEDILHHVGLQLVIL
uniref:Gustatory receptor n=1 Tax=Tribolium castaneum TaxID=7070 RepID=C0Z3Q2_TRICA|nr:olfactory receptor 5 [Tribolium castaneum]